MWEKKGGYLKYIGQAIDLKERTDSHITNAFSKNEKKRKKVSAFEKELRISHPKDWKLSILIEDLKRKDLDFQEIKYIMEKKTLTPHGLNQEIKFKEWDIFEEFINHINTILKTKQKNE